MRFCDTPLAACLAGLGIGILGSFTVYKTLTLSSVQKSKLMFKLFPSSGADEIEKEEINSELARDVGEAKDYYPYPHTPYGTKVFATRCAVLCEKYTLSLRDFTGESGEATCIDMGCSTESPDVDAYSFVHVLGIDPSKERISAAEKLLQERKAEYTMIEEGDLKKEYEVWIDPNVELDGVKFMVQDPNALPDVFAGADCVLAAQLLTRLSQPRKFLESLPHLLKADGTAVIVSDYAWDASITPKQHQLGGYTTARGEKILSEDELKKVMTGLRFELQYEENIPLLKRISARKFEWIMTQATVWRRGEEETST